MLPKMYKITRDTTAIKIKPLTPHAIPTIIPTLSVVDSATVRSTAIGLMFSTMSMQLELNLITPSALTFVLENP